MVWTRNKKTCNKVGLLCKRISNYQEIDGGNDKGQEEIKKRVGAIDLAWVNH
jgi:hypothetical protein